jgi:predicted ATP-binding protein involved in virulence
MRLKKITFNNFRCFDKLEVDLHPRLTVFVGENGSGKTAILDGIATALTPTLTHLSSANQRLNGRGIKDTDFRIESWGKHTEKEESPQLEMDLPTPQSQSPNERITKERWGASDYAQVIAETMTGLKWDYWRPSAVGKEPANKFGVSNLQAYLSQISDSFKTNPSKLMPIFAYYGAMRGNVAVPGRLRTSKENYSYPAAALIGALDSVSDFKEILKWFDFVESAELRANKEVYNDEPERSPALDAVREAVLSLLGGKYKNPHFNKDHKFVLEPVGGGGPLQVAQLSQGYQSMLALAMDFSRRMAIGNGHLTYENDFWKSTLGKEIEELDAAGFFHNIEFNTKSALALCSPAIMLVDEIDLHLHSSWQQRVLGDLMRTFPLTQFIVTTHSPQVLSTVRRENIRVIEQTNGKYIAEPPLAMTYGEPSGDVMRSVMQVDPQPPVAEKKDLERLTELVDQGVYANDEVQHLISDLKTKLSVQHPQLLRLYRSMQRQEALKHENR